MSLSWTVLTLFPNSISNGPLAESMLARARDSGAVSWTAVDIRDFAEGAHRVCDDVPYGGGPGMVMKPEPVVRAFRSAAQAAGGFDAVLAPSSSGERFTDAVARDLAKLSRICVICGHYEGIDQRAIDLTGAREIAIGDYVLTGGETAALVIIDAVSRFVPGVLGAAESADRESFSLPGGLLEHPHYTRPAEFEGQSVPAVLMSGNHGEIEAWRARQSIQRTRERRPDLFDAEKIKRSTWSEFLDGENK